MLTLLMKLSLFEVNSYGSAQKYWLSINGIELPKKPAPLMPSMNSFALSTHSEVSLRTTYLPTVGSFREDDFFVVVYLDGSRDNFPCFFPRVGSGSTASPIDKYPTTWRLAERSFRFLNITVAVKR